MARNGRRHARVPKSASAAYHPLDLLQELRCGTSGDYLSDHGFALGGDVDIKLLVLGISPELRYSRWGQDANVTGYAEIASSSNVNQAGFLVGLSF